MLGRAYDTQVCSIAGTLEVIGERWTLLIVRDAFLGTRRFDDFQRNLGIARNVLQTRLERLVEEGVLERRQYQERPQRWEYRLTDKGIDLWPVLVALMSWGDRHVYPDGPPVVIEHRGCGGAVDDRRICTKCGALLEARDVRAHRREPALQ
jgi:DNA-binding HxlR family transcriptional regulator